WMIDSGCSGIVALGSLGEGATLEFDEKLAVLQTLVRTLRIPIVATISALSTSGAVLLAKKAEDGGCSGLMVLPPYVYSTDWREMKAHVSAVLRATKLSCMLYNNPIAYRTDFLPEQIAELAEEHSNLQAVKESAADIRRLTSIRSLLGNRLAIFVGVDDLIVEGMAAGAVGWIAGLVNALPKESVALFNGADIYRWFLPLLRLDTMPKFVQLIKLVQSEVGMGSERVRPPRLELAGDERESALRVIRTALASRPRV
ncbi:MAG TPA: dihydrodipicolinate synthase family protein, partial [Thermoanaerobaculia bacterium]|nr:dihydrodipicolinate synthase family protein [Thermoanaerobaculia bacterium]